MGGYWETEFLSKASRGQSDGYSFTSALHRSGETLSYGSTVSKLNNFQLLRIVKNDNTNYCSHQYGIVHMYAFLVSSVFPASYTLVLLLWFVRLPHVTVLNGSVVTDGEREDAERFFIRYHLDCPEDELPQRWPTCTLSTTTLQLSESSLCSSSHSQVVPSNRCKPVLISII